LRSNQIPRTNRRWILDELQAPEIVEVDDPAHSSVLIYNDERGDFFILHEGKGHGGEGLTVDGDWAGVHNVAGGVLKGVRAIAFQKASQVAVRDHSYEAPGLGFEHSRHTKLLMRHFVDDFRHRCAGGDVGEGFGRMHDFADTRQTTAYAASRMKIGKVFGPPSTASAQFECEGIAERKHDGGRGGWSEVEGTGLGRDTGIEKNIAGLSERRGSAAGERDKRYLESLEDGEETEKLFGFSAIRESNDDVPCGDHAHIAVYGLCCVQKVGWSSGRTKRCGELAGDDPALAYARDGDPTLLGGCSE